MNGMLIWMEKTKLKDADAAIEFLKNMKMFGLNGFLHQLQK